MRFSKAALTAFVIVFAAALTGCSDASRSIEHGSAEAASEKTEEHGNEGAGEHARESEGDRGSEAENGKKGGEEAGTEYALDATYDTVRKGVRLVMAYDAENNAFVGTVENVTDQSLEAVRVEVHLSNGMELGPTMQTDLEPGQERSVMLEAGDTDFSGWTPHAEVGRDEHGTESGHN